MAKIGADFGQVQTWVFDLDNTLYPPSMGLFSQIDRKMTAFVMRELGLPAAEADRLRHDYWRGFGTTLAGLMQHHRIDPVAYMTEVHDIDFTVLIRDPALRGAIADLPGRRIIYTNGSAPYAERVLEARGLSGLFDAIYGAEHAGYAPKPQPQAFAAVFGADGFDTARAAMFEDDPRNLEVPHGLGMRTVHVAPEPLAALPAYVQHHTADLAGFLRGL